MNSLLKYLNGTGMERAQIEEISTRFFPLMSSSIYLLRYGQVANRLYFIEEGFVFLDVKINGGQVVRHIGRNGEFITSIDSFLNQNPSKECLRRLKNSKVYFIDRQELFEIRKQYPSIEKIFTAYISQSLINCQQRIGDLLTLDAEAYYGKLLSEHKILVLSVPQQELASYLGIAPQSLSRIRRSILTVS